MPQTWLVVQCYQCKAFQVDQEKKVKKWACKLCGEKQSLQRVFARSHSAKDCRLVVQQYNTARGAVEEEEAERALQAAYQQEEEDGGDWAEDEWEQSGMQPQQPQQPQRWEAFQAQDDEEDEGWTVAAPERPAGGKPKRSGTHAGGGSKRRRQAQQEQGSCQQDVWEWEGDGRSSSPGWGAADGGYGSWQQGEELPGQQALLHQQRQQAHQASQTQQLRQSWQQRDSQQQQWQQQASQQLQQHALRDPNGRHQEQAWQPALGGWRGMSAAPQQQHKQVAPPEAGAPGHGSEQAHARQPQQPARHPALMQAPSQARPGLQPAPAPLSWAKPGSAHQAAVAPSGSGGGKWASFAQDDDW